MEFLHQAKGHMSELENAKTGRRSIGCGWTCRTGRGADRACSPRNPCFRGKTAAASMEIHLPLEDMKILYTSVLIGTVIRNRLMKRKLTLIYTENFYSKSR